VRACILGPKGKMRRVLDKSSACNAYDTDDMERPGTAEADTATVTLLRPQQRAVRSYLERNAASIVLFAWDSLGYSKQR